MEFETIAEAALLGVVEGLTEFIPVSSTAHVLLAGHFLGFESAAKAFEVLIQLGAILAVLTVYSARLIAIARDLPSDPSARRFVAGIVLAFLPAAVIGVFAHGFIKTVLFESPALICVVLIIGGIILLAIDRMTLRPVYHDVREYPLSLCLKIGLFQVLAMVPGTSRSGATIVGALLMGTDKRSAAEFTFFLAMPTMAGAFAYDLYQNYDVLQTSDLALIGIGFVVSLIAAVFVVRNLLDFVSNYGFAPFAWWRMFIGTVGLLGLWLFG